MEDIVWLNYTGGQKRTAKAILFCIHGQNVWVPKSQILAQDEKVVGVSKWFAKKQGLKGDW